ncbi:MAG TPA: M28 family peptidase [Candidatus Acidoferrum sp.]|nr:M28 family peptidase [Candidatus Acidoferrum sp.]
MLNLIAITGALRRPAIRASLLAWVAAASAIFLAPQWLLAQSAPSTASADLTRYLDDVKALSSPEMEGRGDGTKGLTLAEHLIVERYKSLGLEPAGSKGYLQSFRVVTGRKIQGGTKMSGHANGGKIETYAVHEDFIPLNFSSTGNARASVVFAGYGITAPEFGYDDFHDADVRDKIVLVLRGEPESISEKAPSAGHTTHASLITKAINAKNHGAAALIVVNGKLSHGDSDELRPFGDAEGPEEAGILCLQVKTPVADEWLRPTGLTSAELQDSIEKEKNSGLSIPLDSTVDVTLKIETLRATVNNVLAYLPGKSDEYVIVGAHYDHLGKGDSHSLAPSSIGQIHPGADDNASGTAGVLELARIVAPLAGKLDRGILFANFAGEELGLLGSAEWVKEPTRPLDKAVAMLNMDMIGRIKDDKVFIGGIGTGTTLKSAVEDAANGSSLHFEYSEGGYSSSDHTSFVTKKIPVLFFFSGLHSDYHKPSDTWDKINAASATQLLNLVSKVTVELAEAAEKPKFVAVVENPHVGGVSSGGGYGPYFGSVPDFGQTETGVRFSDVRPSSPAAKAGLQAGDVLVHFGDKSINNLYDFTDALRRSKVGDVVEVTVLRNGQPLKVSVTLEQRK